MAPVRIGILGTARVTDLAFFQNIAQTPEVVLIGVASRDGERAKAFATQHGLSKSYGRYEDLIADPEVELVYNPLPNNLHAYWSIAALRAGKAVLCEKPLAANAAQAAAMRDAGIYSQRPLIEGFHYRHHPLMKFVRRVLAEGQLGALQFIEAGMNIAGHHFKSEDIRFDASLGGGAMMDVGTYCVDVLRVLASSEPVVVSAEAARRTPRIDGAMRAELRFGNLPARFECSLQDQSTRMWLTIRGEAGELHVDNPFVPQWGHELRLSVGGATELFQFDSTPSHVFQARHVAAVIRDGVMSECDADNGLANMMVIDKIYVASGLSPRE